MHWFQFHDSKSQEGCFIISVWKTVLFQGHSMKKAFIMALKNIFLVSFSKIESKMVLYTFLMPYWSINRMLYEKRLPRWKSPCRGRVATNIQDKKYLIFPDFFTYILLIFPWFSLISPLFKIEKFPVNPPGKPFLLMDEFFTNCRSFLKP